MKKYLLQFFAFCLCFSLHFSAQSQLADGTFAPNFEAVDVNGNTQNLYDILADGYKVILDFSTTWCGPCWDYHITNALKDLHNTYGPNGTQEVYVLFIESDDGTTMADLQGTTQYTQGDWLTGTTYPIVDDGAYIADMYGIQGYPTL